MNYALQLYSVRDFAKENIFTTLTKVKNMGYDGIELAGLYDYCPIEIKKHLDSINLKAISAHIDITMLDDNKIEQTIQTYNKLGCSFIVVPYLSEEYCLGNEKYNYVIKQLKKACNVAKKYNMFVMYHNHEFEFNYKNNNGNMLNDLYNNINMYNFKLQPDLAWVKIAGNNPIDYMENNYNKIGTIHCHDYKIINDKIEFRPVGYGCQDIKSILNKSEELKLDWIIIEQDDPSMNKNSLECAKMSIEYIKGLDK